MGTSTIFRRHNDMQRRLADMKKSELTAIDNISAYASDEKKAETLPGGWSCSLELHNSDTEVLLWYRGRLMRLHDAPPQLLGFHYNRWRCKTEKRTEWSVARRILKIELWRAEKAFGKAMRMARKDKAKRKLDKLRKNK